jgi:phospholipid transport system transporter-binding protein
VIERRADGFAVSGPVTLATLTAVLAEAREVWPGSGGGDLVVDLGAAGPVDSAAVSLLLSWRRLAREQGFEVRFRDLPPNLRSLASLYGVDGFIAGGRGSPASAA